MWSPALLGGNQEDGDTAARTRDPDGSGSRAGLETVRGSLARARRHRQERQAGPTNATVLSGGRASRWQRKARPVLAPVPQKQGPVIAPAARLSVLRVSAPTSRAFIRPHGKGTAVRQAQDSQRNMSPCDQCGFLHGAQSRRQCPSHIRRDSTGAGRRVARSVKQLPSAQVMIPGSQDRDRNGAPCSAGSLLLPLRSLCFCSVSQINK